MARIDRYAKRQIAGDDLATGKGDGLSSQPKITQACNIYCGFNEFLEVQKLLRFSSPIL